MGTHRRSSYFSLHRVRFAHPEFTEFIVHRRTASRHRTFVVVAVARASTDDATFRPFGRATRWGRAVVVADMCLSFCVHSVYVDSSMYRVSEERRVGHGSSRPRPPHALVVETFVHLTNGCHPRARAKSRESVGRSSGRSVVVPAEAEAEAEDLVRTRRRFAPAMSATAQFSSSAITGCVSARRERRLVSRAFRSSVPNPIDRLDRIRARGKIRAWMMHSCE